MAAPRLVYGPAPSLETFHNKWSDKIMDMYVQQPEEPPANWNEIATAKDVATGLEWRMKCMHSTIDHITAFYDDASRWGFTSEKFLQYSYQKSDTRLKPMRLYKNVFLWAEDAKPVIDCEARQLEAIKFGKFWLRNDFMRWLICLSSCGNTSTTCFER